MPTLEELIAAGPGVGQPIAPRKPLGVPADYMAQRPGNSIFLGPGGTSGEIAYGGMVPLPPRYFTGDEFLPGSRPPDQIADLQRQLIAAGLMKPTGFRLGVWDAETVDAYAALLAYANSTGLDQADALSRYGAGQQQGTTERKPASFVPRLSRPEDLQSLADAMAVRTLGRKMNESESAAFVKSFSQTQRAAQEEYYQAMAAAQDGGPSTTTYEEPDAQLAAIRSAKEQAPQEAASFDAVNRFQQFSDLLRRTGS